MKQEQPVRHTEGEPKISTFPPALEAFLHPTNEDAAWLKSVAENPEFRKQVQTRKELNARLDKVLARLPRPDVTLQEAISEHHLSEQDVAELYTSLTALLTENRDYERIILYLPFEFLPNTEWKPASAPLQHAMTEFRAAYMKAWSNLLFVHDVRANFVDGDVLEVGRRDGDPERVVKAAHLIPKLVENGLLRTNDVFQLRETTDDDVLRQSITATLPILVDLGLAQEYELDRIDVPYSNPVTLREAIASKKVVSLDSVQEQLMQELERVDAHDYGDVGKLRKSWLQQEDKRRAIESASDDLERAVIQDSLDDGVVTEVVASNTHPETQQALIDGIRKAIETVAKTDQQAAQILYTKYRPRLVSLWQKNSIKLKDHLTKTFCRLQGLGVIKDEELHALGVIMPALAGPFSENLKRMKQETDEIKSIVAAIEKNSELSQYIYPVVLILGSRLKGYGSQTADIDVAVFIKPGTDPDERKTIQALLKQTLVHEKIDGAAFEFWLEKTNDGLAVRDDFDPAESSIGGSHWTYTLFGAAWEGNAEIINKLREQLLIPYFFETDKQMYDRDARGLYLEEIERDALQYRLMHKGYERFRPPFGGIHTAHADLVDGKSMFWDSGYRQVATQLFTRRVFLPKISKPE